MRRAIWKYPLELKAFQTVKMPRGGQVILVAIQNSSITLWVEFRDDASEIEVSFYIVGTGRNVPEAAEKHVGSVTDGAFVWHVYERRDR